MSALSIDREWAELTAEYPVLTGLDSAFRGYISKLTKPGADRAKLHAEVMAGVRRWRSSVKWLDEDGELDTRFIPGLDTFLGVNPKRMGGPMYLDQPPQWKPKKRVEQGVPKYVPSWEKSA